MRHLKPELKPLVSRDDVSGHSFAVETPTAGSRGYAGSQLVLTSAAARRPLSDPPLLFRRCSDLGCDLLRSALRSTVDGLRARQLSVALGGAGRPLHEITRFRHRDDRTQLPAGLTRPAHWPKTEGLEDQPTTQPDDARQPPAADDAPGPDK